MTNELDLGFPNCPHGPGGDVDGPCDCAVQARYHRKNIRNSISGYSVRKGSPADALLREYERKLWEVDHLTREAQEVLNEMKRAEGYIA